MATASVPNTFASAVTATGLQLDNNFSTIVAYINEPLNRNNWATDSGNTDTIVLTFSPPVSAYSAGLEITFKAANTNTGATVINANSLGNKNFIQPGGSALAAGQIEANGIYKAAYNGSAFVYIGQNVLAASAGDVQTATSAITFVSPSTLPAAAATQGNLETATATVGFLTPANAKYHPGLAKAWGYVTQETTSYTLSANYNVSSVARGGTGTVTIIMASALSSTAYAVLCTSAGASNNVVADTTARTTTSFVTVLFATNSGAAFDVGFSFAVYGDLP